VGEVGLHGGDGTKGPERSLPSLPRRSASGAHATVTGVVRLVVVALAAILLGVAAAMMMVDYLRVVDVRLPDVRGEGYDVAIATLRELGFRPVTYPELDAAAAPDAVVSQAPLPGDIVRRGRTVRLGINALSEARQVPTVVGLAEADAVARATNVNVPVARVSYVDSDRPTGTVIRQEPEPGAPFRGQGGMHLVVSRGIAALPLALPDVRGMARDDAVRALQSVGIRQIDTVASAVSFDRPFVVTDQRPAPGSEIVTSTPVTLVYALEGARVVRVPEIVGEPLWRGQLQLRAAQLGLGPVQEIDDPTRPVGIVEVRPSGYTLVGSPVALVVNGPVPDAERLPLDLVDVDRLPTDHRDSTPLAPRLGGPGGDAVLDPTAGAPADPAPGRADDGVPAPGTTVDRGDGSRLIPFRFDPALVGVASLMRDPYRLTLIVSDDRGERTVFDRELRPGESVALSLEIHGDDPLLQTFVNDSFFQAWRP
jgi:beta-lactam-binding protein with PASTA domain